MMDWFVEELEEFIKEENKKQEIAESEYYEMAQVLENLFSQKEVIEVRKKLETQYLTNLCKPKSPIEAYQDAWFRQGLSKFFQTIDYIISKKREKDNLC